MKYAVLWWYPFVQFPNGFSSLFDEIDGNRVFLLPRKRKCIHRKSNRKTKNRKTSEIYKSLFWDLRKFPKKYQIAEDYKIKKLTITFIKKCYWKLHFRRVEKKFRNIISKSKTIKKKLYNSPVRRFAFYCGSVQAWII